MNSSFLKFVLMAVSALFIGMGIHLNAADTTVDTNATPGTDAAQATKSQPNNPSGPAAQNAGTPVASPDSKTGSTTDANHSTSVKKAGAASASKSVQKKHQKKKIKKDQATGTSAGTM